MSREIRQIITAAEENFEKEVETRLQHHTTEQQEYDKRNYSKNIVVISQDPLIFSVPYGHGTFLERCFVVLCRDKNGEMKCQCSNPNSLVYRNHVIWVRQWIQDHPDFHLNSYTKKRRNSMHIIK